MPEQAPKPSPEHVPPKPRPRRPCWGWVGLLALLIAGLILVGAWNRFMSPEAIRSELMRQARPYVNGSLRLDEARLRFLRDLRLNGIEARLPGASEAELTIESARADLNPWAYLGGQVEIRSVTLVRPFVRLVIRQDASCRLLDLFDTPRWQDTGGAEDERLFADGIRCEDATVEFRDPFVFGDDRARRFQGLWITWMRSPSTLSAFDFEVTFKRRPLRGLRVRGWSSVEAPWEVRARADFSNLNLTAELTKLLPASVEKELSRFKLNGRLSGSASLELRRNQADNYDLDIRLGGADIQWIAPGLLFEQASCSLHVSPEGASLRDISAVLWEGLATGEATVRFDPQGPRRFQAWTQAHDLQISSLLAQFAPDEEPRPGRLSASVRFFGDLRRPEKIAAVGVLDMKDAAVVKLPLIANVLARLNLSLAPSEMLRTGQVFFHVDFEQGVVHLDRLTVQSANIEISGRGWVDFDGDLDIMTVAALSRAVKTTGVPILTDLVDFFVGGLQRAITPPVRVFGNVKGAIQTQTVPLEGIRRPFTDLLELVAAPERHKRPK